MFKKICLIILGLIFMVFGLYGLIVWWWPLFVQIFLGLAGVVVFFIGLGMLIIGWATETKRGKSKIIKEETINENQNNE